MVNYDEKITDIQIELSEKDQRLLGYKTISFDELIDEYDSLKYELEELQEEYDNFKQEVESNYRPIPMSEHLGIDDTDFYEDR